MFYSLEHLSKICGATAICEFNSNEHQWNYFVLKLMCNDRILHGDFCVTTKNQLAITLFSCVFEPHEVLPEASHNGIDVKIIPISLSYFRT